MAVVDTEVKKRFFAQRAGRCRMRTSKLEQTVLDIFCGNSIVKISGCYFPEDYPSAFQANCLVLPDAVSRVFWCAVDMCQRRMDFMEHRSRLWFRRFSSRLFYLFPLHQDVAWSSLILEVDNRKSSNKSGLLRIHAWWRPKWSKCSCAWILEAMNGSWSWVCTCRTGDKKADISFRKARRIG